MRVSLKRTWCIDQLQRLNMLPPPSFFRSSFSRFWVETDISPTIFKILKIWFWDRTGPRFTFLDSYPAGWALNWIWSLPYCQFDPDHIHNLSRRPKGSMQAFEGWTFSANLLGPYFKKAVRTWHTRLFFTTSGSRGTTFSMEKEEATKKIHYFFDC
jgi:hypothetical protein